MLETVQTDEIPLPLIQAEKNPMQGQARYYDETDCLFHQQKCRHEIAIKNMERGWLGKFFGMGTSTGINIAGLVCVLTLGVLITSLFCEIEGDVNTIRTALIGLIASALSYIFGASRGAD